MAKKNRKLYKIGYITELLGISPRTIRYYDQVGLLPHVKRSEGGVRLFDEEDVIVLQKIKKMQQQEYLPLDVIKDRLFGQKNSSKMNTKMIVTDTTASLPKEVLRKSW